MEDTASSYIARCPACRVRFSVHLKRDAVADEYVKLLQEHASAERILFENDEEVRAWLRRGKAKGEILADRPGTGGGAGRPDAVQSSSSGAAGTAGTHFWQWRLGHAGSRDDRAQIFIRHKHLAPLYALTLDRNDLLCEPLGAAATR